MALVLSSAAMAKAPRWWPATAALGVALAVGCAAEALAWRVPGPPGFDVTVTDARGAVVAHARAEKLLTPEIAPTPPPHGALVARATFLAARAGVYTWQLGASSASSLRVDGVFLYSPRPGRVAMKEQMLAAGLHELEIAMPNADAAGAIAFGVRPPWRPWRGALAGPGFVVARPRADVAARLGAHAVAILWLLGAAPALVLLLALVAIGLALGAAGRARVRAYVLSLADDAGGRRFLVALAFLVLVVPLVSPLFEPGFFACGEEESYIVRLGEFERAIRGGVPLGRWWPDPVFGRGYPFLCLYAPLLYLVAAPLLLVGFSPVAVVKILSGAVIVAGGAGVYRLARRVGSPAAALLAATLFLYAPYLHTDVYIREDLAESLAFACFPLAILALERALDAVADRAARDVAWLGLAVGALGSAHNITAYFAVYFLGLWVVLRVALRTTTRQGVARAVAGGLVGFLLCVFYAVPALVDSKRVWIERLMTGYYNPEGHFMSPLAFFHAAPRWDMLLYLGAPATVAMLAGIVAVCAKRPAGERIASRPPGARTLAILAAAGVVLAFIIATRPTGRWFVKHVPLANHMTFPWRLLLFAATLAPLCVPAALDGFLRSARARWLLSGACAALLVVTLAPYYGPPAPLVRSRLDIVTFLRGLDVDYVTSMNEYLPKTVRRTVRRFGDVVHVAAGNATVAAQSRSPGRYAATVDARDDATLEFNAHWFPGWRATVDGAAHDIGPGRDGFDDGGLIRVRVPPGHHEVALRYGRTPLRWACDLVSLAALLGVLALFALSRRRYATGGK